MRDSETNLSQTVGPNLESVMLKAGYDEDLDREWVPMSHVPSLHNKHPSFPIICGFAYSRLEDSDHLQLATHRVADGAARHRDAPDTSVPWDSPPSGVSNLYLPPGPNIQRFPFL
jgi:hypothetical protein